MAIFPFVLSPILPLGHDTNYEGRKSPLEICMRLPLTAVLPQGLISHTFRYLFPV